MMNKKFFKTSQEISKRVKTLYKIEFIVESGINEFCLTQEIKGGIAQLQVQILVEPMYEISDMGSTEVKNLIGFFVTGENI